MTQSSFFRNSVTFLKKFGNFLWESYRISILVQFFFYYLLLFVEDFFLVVVDFFVVVDFVLVVVVAATGL